jgi:hypothetical protein
MVNKDDFVKDAPFPWEDVESARKNKRLQQEYPVAEGQQQYAAIAKACPQCHTAASQLNWFYFKSPSETWECLCGRAGWMTVCDRCHLQVDLFIEAMN